MDDLKFGTRNKRGDWAPNARLELAPYLGTGRSAFQGR